MKQLGYLTIEFCFPGFFSFSVLFLGCFSSAQSGSHLTHAPCHTCTPVGQLHCQHQNIIHMAMSSPLPLLSFPLLHHLSPCQSSTCTLTLLQALIPARTHTHTHTGVRTHTHARTHTHTHTLTPVHAQRERDGRGRCYRMLEWTEGGWGKRELERREG